MMFAEADERQTDLVRKDSLIDDVAKHRGLRPRLPRLVVRYVTKTIEPEFDLIHPMMISATSSSLSPQRYCTVTRRMFMPPVSK